jgi:hypothetical protein
MNPGSKDIPTPEDGASVTDSNSDNNEGVEKTMPEENEDGKHGEGGPPSKDMTVVNGEDPGEQGSAPSTTPEKKPAGVLSGAEQAENVGKKHMVLSVTPENALEGAVSGVEKTENEGKDGQDTSTVPVPPPIPISNQRSEAQLLALRKVVEERRAKHVAVKKERSEGAEKARALKKAQTEEDKATKKAARVAQKLAKEEEKKTKKKNVKSSKKEKENESNDSSEDDQEEKQQEEDNQEEDEQEEEEGNISQGRVEKVTGAHLWSRMNFQYFRCEWVGTDKKGKPWEPSWEPENTLGQLKVIKQYKKENKTTWKNEFHQDCEDMLEQEYAEDEALGAGV